MAVKLRVNYPLSPAVPCHGQHLTPKGLKCDDSDLSSFPVYFCFTWPLRFLTLYTHTPPRSLMKSNQRAITAFTPKMPVNCGFAEESIAISS